MATDDSQTPAKPHGHSLRWTPNAIADKARIGGDDIASARSLWHRVVPKRLRHLLDARSVTPSTNGN